MFSFRSMVSKATKIKTERNSPKLVNQITNYHQKAPTSIIKSKSILWFRSGITHEQLKFLAQLPVSASTFLIFTSKLGLQQIGGDSEGTGEGNLQSIQMLISSRNIQKYPIDIQNNVFNQISGSPIK